MSRKLRPQKRRPLTTDLENADLENTDLENTDLENADLENTDHENADVENMDLANKDLENTDVSQTLKKISACARERIMAAMKSLSSSFFFLWLFAVKELFCFQLPRYRKVDNGRCYWA